jgi:hypothetical protein
MYILTCNREIVTSQATLKEIRTAYKKLLKEYPQHCKCEIYKKVE